MDTIDQIIEFQDRKEDGNTKIYRDLEKYIQNRLLQFCIILLDYNLANNKYQSIIISGLAVLGLQERGR